MTSIKLKNSLYTLRRQIKFYKNDKLTKILELNKTSMNYITYVYSVYSSLEIVSECRKNISKRNSTILLSAMSMFY